MSVEEAIEILVAFRNEAELCIEYEKEIGKTHLPRHKKWLDRVEALNIAIRNLQRTIDQAKDEK